MGFVNLVSGLSDQIGKLIYDVLYKWIAGWSSGWSVVGAFSITVIMFTLFLKVLVSPLDIWQKHLARKNAKIMEEMKPKLEKITKQCGSNRELLMQKQRALYKEHKYSAFSSCLPMILSLAIFFIVFGGFNSAVRLHNQTVYNQLETIYTTEYKAAIADAEADETLTSIQQQSEYANDRAAAKVLAAYKSEQFLLTGTKNIFVSDTWKNPVPSAADFTGGGMGKLNISIDNPEMYAIVMAPVMEEYNTGWNGYLVLPILVFLVNILSMKLNKMPDQPQMAGQTEEQRKAQQSQAKMMQFLMPIMMLVFSLFYSAAFTLYMLMNTLLTTIVNLVYNMVTKRLDAKEKDRIMSTTVKK